MRFSTVLHFGGCLQAHRTGDARAVAFIVVGTEGAPSICSFPNGYRLPSCDVSHVSHTLLVIIRLHEWILNLLAAIDW